MSPQFDAVHADGPAAQALRALRMPLLFLCGEATVPAARRMAQRLRRACPAARHESVPGGHMSPVTHAAEVGARIERFLREHAGHPAIDDSLHFPPHRTQDVRQEIT